MKVPTMYTRLIQGYHAMDPELQAVSASAARNLRLMVSDCGTHLPFLSLGLAAIYVMCADY